MRCGHSEPSNPITSLGAISVYPFSNEYKIKLQEDDSVYLNINNNEINVYLI